MQELIPEAIPEGIPWHIIGPFGTFIIVVIGIILYFVFKLKKNNPGTRCVNAPKVTDAFIDLGVMKESSREIKVCIKDLCRSSTENTTILKGLHGEAKEQTKVLTKIAQNIGRN